MSDGKLDDVEKKPLVQRLLEYRLPSGELLPEKDVISEHMGHLCVLLCWENVKVLTLPD